MFMHIIFYIDKYFYKIDLHNWIKLKSNNVKVFVRNKPL